MLKLLVKSANELIDVDFGPSNKSDPYVKAVFRGEERKTEYINDELNPVWTSEHHNEFEWELGTQPILLSDEIHVKVRDWEKILHRRLLGQVVISLKDLLRTKDYTIEQCYHLVDGYNRPTVSTILLRLQYLPSRKVLAYMADEIDGGVLEEDDEVIEGEEKDEEGKPGRHKRRKQPAIMQGRREWSTRKRHYKISIKIHEGRQLPGANISPVARITIKKHRHETRVKRSTNSPVFNQTFTFNFHCSEAELFDDLIVIEVFNSRKLFRNALLGFFESDIGAIYEYPGHAIIRKWVLLTGSGLLDDDDEQSNISKWLRRRGRDGGTAGYLKVTMIVLGSGDEPPVEEKREDDDDIESNCLMPAGISREPAEFHMKVYLAEDLPQMDTGYASTFRKLFLPGKGKEDPSERKKLVDPFLVFSFSGKEVKTTTKYRRNNPSFNELLRLPLLYPSMCERIKLQLYDWDQGTKNDIIGTTYLSLPEISGRDYSSAFLPHFGPCFINFYGSPREFHVFNSEEFEDLNKGIGEGVAYRGRVLVELTQEKASGNLRSSIQHVHDEDIFRVQPFLRQEKYKLFACFKNAAMIGRSDKAIEFEVSIGNFGNTLDETEVSCNTPPTNPVYDGCHYHYLPWHHYKPCICLNCNWEDISFRIEPLNIINKLCEKLGTTIKKVKEDLEQFPADTEKRIALVRSCLQKIIDRCSNTKFLKLPGTKNTLDIRLSKLRQDEFEFVVQEAMETIKKFVSQGEPWLLNVDLDKIVNDMEDYVERLKSLAFEPQISIPDVIIWMLCGGSRIAYHRIPIQDVLYSPIKDARGKHCGKTIELLLKYPGKTEFDKEYHEVPAMIRVELWVGLVEYQQEWIQRDAQEGTFEIYAETYENEINIFREWCHPRLSLRPHFSNASGDVPLEKEKFVVPRGWKFNGDWKGVLDRSLMYDHDWALSIYTEEIYEHQNRNLLGGEWSEKSNWTEEDGQPSRSIKDFQEPEGWRWQSSSWKVDADRAVDAEGWEYCISEGFGGIYVKAAKAIHMTRRRRWVRTRELMDLTEKRKKDEIQTLAEESWEYAVSFQSKYHVKPRSRDLVRRKRLLKEIVHDGNGTVDLPPRLAINLKIKHKKKTKKSKAKEKSGQETAAEDYDIMEGEREGILAVLPRMFIVYQTPRKYQLWVYIYQARDLLAMDDTGRSDPYVRVAFCNQSQKTEWQQQSLCPKWDQTLVFPQVELFDTIENVVRRPPNIIMEVFDRDPVGKHDFVGRCMMQPLVQIKGSGSPPVLTWITLYNGQANAGQVLATAELFLDEGEQLPGLPRQKASKKSHYVYPVRHHIRPKLQTVGVEILCWGVRNMKTFNYRNVDRPSVEFEWGNHIFQSEVLENAKKNPNFKKPNLTREIVQLEEEPFTPAMSIRVYDNRRFTQKPLVGIISISSLEMSNLQPLSQTGDYEEPASPFSPSPRPQRRIIEEHKKEREEFDWWSKYHYSMSKMSTRKHIKRESTIFSGIFSSDDESAKDHLDIYEDKKHDALEIFHSELEKEERFDGLNDFVTTLKLKRGKWKGEEEDEEDIVGELKTSIRVYQVDEENKEKLPPGMFDDLSEVKMHWPMKCLVRVYVICAHDLQPHDPSGLADPYLIVSFGGKTQDDKDNVQHNTLEPVFGRMFEFNAAIPVAKDLKIKVVDDDPGFDDDIGETTIDLEQRLMSRLHASCGLQKSYLVGGPYAWRDSKRPKDILSDYCHAKGYKPPYFYPKGNTPNTLVLKATRSPATHDQTFKLGEIEDFDEHRPYLGSIDQQLSLHALHCLGLVPEHVETRSLYSSLQPGIEQGKLKLWVDIFPKTESADIKPAVDIKPRTPLPYVLRVIIWDTTNVVLQETTFTGEGMSDIYVKGWIDGTNKKQKTDVHYRSLDGDGNFNWRMCFPLMIMPIEKKLVISKKENVLQMHKTTEKLDPLLKIQIWENDKFSPDDFLGTRTLCLNDLIRPCKSPRRCGTKNDPIHRKKRPDDYLDLFRGGSKSIRGWYACWKDETQLGGPVAGKVDMSIEILTEAQANASPAGLGREEPNQHPNLPEPDRPKTSFLWFTSPFKSMRYIIWRNYKWKIIGLIITILLVLLILLFVYNVPGYSVKKIFRV